MISRHGHKKLVIGIDYGTTNSGVAYAVVTDENDDNKVDINVIRDWPHGVREEKLPSDIAYDDSGSPVGYALDFPDDAQPLQWVKLLLEPAKLGKTRQDENDRVWRSYSELNRLGKMPVDAIADYLRWLWEQVERALRDSGDDLDSADEVVVVITLPASWSDRAKNGMLLAAQKAGIDANGRALKFRIEPEAAALFELKARSRRGQIAVGDCFIVCDAGGGTVDVVTFQVISLDPLSLNQVVVADADFCGSAFINAEFESQLRFFLGSDYDKLSIDVQNQISDVFERKIKRKYNPLALAEYSVPVTGLADNERKGIKNGRFMVKEGMLRRSFEDIMTQVLSLIDRQKDGLKAKNALGNLKAILLVGGFGASEYLHTRVRQEYPEDEGVRVWKGAQSWTAVVQGAVQCEVANRTVFPPVNTRLSRFHYGIPYRLGDSRKVHWFVHKGQNVRDSSHIEPYLLRLEDQPWLDQDEFVTISVQLVKSTKDTVTEDDDSSLEPHVDINCRVPTSIRSSPEAELIQRHPKIWRIPAELILAMDGPLLTIRCRMQGNDVGILDLRYHDEPAFPSHALSSVQTTSRAPDSHARTESTAAENNVASHNRFSIAPSHDSRVDSMPSPPRYTSFPSNLDTAMDNGPPARWSAATLQSDVDSVLSPSTSSVTGGSVGAASTSTLPPAPSAPLPPPPPPPSAPAVQPAIPSLTPPLLAPVSPSEELAIIPSSGNSNSPSPRPERHSRSGSSFFSGWRRSSSNNSNNTNTNANNSEQRAANRNPSNASAASNTNSSKKTETARIEEWVPCTNRRTGEKFLKSRVTGEVIPAPLNDMMFTR